MIKNSDKGYKKNKQGKYGESKKKEYGNTRKAAIGSSTDRENSSNPDAENIIAGRNPVAELIKSGRTVDKIFISHTEKEGPLAKIIKLAKQEGIPVVEADRDKLERISGIKNHQGVAAFTTDFVYSDVKEIVESAREKGEQPFILIIDGITDPGNLGAIIRTADACGVHGIILPKRNTCGLTSTVFKAAAGACEYVKISKVVNIANTINELKEMNIWIYGLDGEADGNLYQTDLKGSCAFVLGDEGKGVSRLVKDRCDYLIKIPMRGMINSLNVSVAGAVCMYERLRQTSSEN